MSTRLTKSVRAEITGWTFSFKNKIISRWHFYFCTFKKIPTHPQEWMRIGSCHSFIFLTLLILVVAQYNFVNSLYQSFVGILIPFSKNIFHYTFCIIFFLWSISTPATTYNKINCNENLYYEPAIFFSNFHCLRI